MLDPRLREWGFPRWGSDMAAGLDLFACLDCEWRMSAGQCMLIPAGLAIHINDPGWCAMIYPRSGLGHRDGLVMGNGTGVIDADYQGPIMVSAWARGPGTVFINPGARIAQMVFHRIARPSFEEIEAFSGATERGAGGFGSTGT